MSDVVDPRTDLDLVRDALAGRLTPEQRDRVAARRASDAELDAMARDLEAIEHIEGAADVPPVPACTLSFDTIRPALDADPVARPTLSRWAPFVAAAAALLVLLGGLLARRVESGPVVLRAITLADVMPPPPLPAAALDYEPTGPTGLQFVDGYKAGQALANATGRPLVVFVHHPTCPVCLALERGPFRDASLATVAGEFVLARASVMREGGALMQGREVGWPAFLVFRADGVEADAFAGAEGSGMAVRSASALATSFTHAASAVRPEGDGAKPAGPAVPTWDAVHTVARALAEARETEDASALWKRLDVAEAAARATTLEERVRRARAAATGDARLALSAAQAFAAAGDVARAGATLEKAAARFHGTPVEGELRQVRDRLLADGKFPALEASR